MKKKKKKTLCGVELEHQLVLEATKWEQRDNHSFFFKWIVEAEEEVVDNREGKFVFDRLRARLVYIFKNWKLLFKNFCKNTCRWKNILKYVKYCLKTENCCLKTLTKHPLNRVLICNGKIKKIRKGCEKVKSLGLWGSVYHILS